MGKYISALILLIAVVIGVYMLTKNPSDTPQQISAPAVDMQVVGASFSLLDHTGKSVTQDDYKGKYLLIYFGYTNCPEICPINLASIAEAMDMFGPLADEITPLFVTIDPEYDSVERMAQHVPMFSDRLIGLTGTPEELAKMASGYRVFYEEYINADRGGSIVDFNHSSLTFLIDRDGKYITHFPDGVEAKTIVMTTTRMIKLLEPDFEIPKLTH